MPLIEFNERFSVQVPNPDVEFGRFYISGSNSSQKL
jgi:hypothetical protein